MNIETFIQHLKEYNIELTKTQLDQFEKYFELLVEWNEKMNLTNITKKEEVYLKHFYDSLTLAFTHSLNEESLCDIGAGAGFPSIPLKIVFPKLKITIVDSLNKRITFLNHLVKELRLTDVQAVAARAEEYVADHRESFDIVSARAVARLNILDELCLPLCKVGGYFITLKGAQGEQELEECKQGIKKLGGKVEKIEKFTLPDHDDQRINIYIHKTSSTPKGYPRMFAKIKKSPLK